MEIGDDVDPSGGAEHQRRWSNRPPVPSSRTKPANPRAAIAHIRVVDGEVPSRGTGFAVGRRLLLTSLHVVADRKAATPVPFGTIEISFGNRPWVKGELVAWDALTDWALLACAVPDDVAPLVLRQAADDNSHSRTFWTWGFPDLNSVDGKTFEGEIRNLRGTFAGKAPAIELYSEEAKGTYVHGLSGAPVFEGASVIGLIRVTLKEDKRSFGTFYATPIAEVLKEALLRDAFVNPYQGLKPFSEERSPYFFGRDKEVGALVSRLARSGERLLTLLGASGSGKSSLALAGMVPAIRAGQLRKETRWLVVTMRPGPRPIHELALRLRQVAESPKTPALAGLRASLKKGGTALSDAVDEELVWRGDGWALLLVVDQLEELFTQGAPAEERETFLELLVEAAQVRGGRAWVLGTLRADFLGPLRESDFEPALRESAALVGPIGAEELEGVIRGPAERVGLRFEENLVERLLADARGSKNDLPLLQFALDFLWRRREVNLITWSAYGAMGGLRGAIARRADEIFLGLPKERQRAAALLFRRLVRIGEAGAPDARRTATHVELAAVNAKYREMLAPFVDERLLVAGDEGVEIAHEAIIAEWARLRAWLDDDRVRRLAEQALAKAHAEWEDAQRSADHLLRGRHLRGTLDKLGNALDEQPDPAVHFLVRSLVEEEGDLAPWLRRFPDTAVVRVLDELHSDRIVRLLAAAGRERAEALGATQRLLGILIDQPRSRTADLAAAAIDDLGLTPSLIVRAEAERAPAVRRALESALAFLRNRPGTGVALDEALPKPLQARIRRGAALRLMADHRTYLVTLVAAAFLVSSAVHQVLLLLDTAIGARGSLAIGTLELIVTLGVGAFVTLRQEVDRRPVGTRSALLIGGVAFLLSQGAWLLSQAFKIALRFLSGGAGETPDLLVQVLFSWTGIFSTLVLAWFFRGTGAPRPSMARVFGVAAAASLVGALHSRFGWMLLDGLLRHRLFLPSVEYQELLIQFAYSTLEVGTVLVTFREIQGSFRPGADAPGRFGLELRRIAVLVAAVITGTVVAGLGAGWLEDRVGSPDARANRGERLLREEGGLDRAIRLLAGACEEMHARSCQLLGEHYSFPHHRRKEALPFYDKGCAFGDLSSCNEGARLATELEDAAAAHKFNLALCKGVDVYACELAAEQEPEGSEAQVELLMRADELSGSGHRALEALEHALELLHAPQSPSPRMIELGEMLCVREPKACWLLAKELDRAGETGTRAARLVAQACNNGYAPACVDPEPSPVSPIEGIARDLGLARLCAEGDHPACERASPAGLLKAAEILWRRGRYVEALGWRHEACARGNAAACQLYGDSHVQLRALRDTWTRVPGDIARQYEADKSIQVTRLPDWLHFRELFSAGVGWSFAQQSYDIASDISLSEKRLASCTDRAPERRAAWIALYRDEWTKLAAGAAELPETTRRAREALEAPDFAPAGTDATVDATPGATYVLRARCGGDRDALVVLHVERVLAEDGSVVIAWKSLR